MNPQEAATATDSQTVSLVVRRTIRASAERLFEAWTRPEHLEKWWGPRGVTCEGAEIDLQVGGGYRLGNRLPDGTLLWITGTFERIAPPHELVYTWRLGPEARAGERVTVRFEPRDGATEVIVIHQHISDQATKAGHECGWRGCLDKLAGYLE